MQSVFKLTSDTCECICDPHMLELFFCLVRQDPGRLILDLVAHHYVGLLATLTHLQVRHWHLYNSIIQLANHFTSMKCRPNKS